jgi:hypothetical protein
MIGLYHQKTKLAECIIDHSKEIKCLVPINKSRWEGRRVRYAGERVGKTRYGDGEREEGRWTDRLTERPNDRTGPERAIERPNDRPSDRAIERAIDRVTKR